jgi:hypothetical protein
LPLLLLAVTACSAPAGDPPPTPPPVETVACDSMLEWIRLRPLSKRCEVDADCTVQTDSCCDQTAVHRRYARICERTCSQQCPQDSLVGHQVTWRPVCVHGSCDLQQVLGAAPPEASK